MEISFTRKDLGTLEGRRKLDALVAEKVMCYTLDYEFEEITHAPNVKELRSQDDEWGILPHYSVDIAAAWTILDAFKRMDHDTKDFIQMHRELHGVTALDATEAAVAICLAALKAIGITL